jgi:hypothetical protein
MKEPLPYGAHRYVLRLLPRPPRTRRLDLLTRTAQPSPVVAGASSLTGLSRADTGRQRAHGGGCLLSVLAVRSAPGDNGVNDSRGDHERAAQRKAGPIPSSGAALVPWCHRVVRSVCVCSVSPLGHQIEGPAVVRRGSSATSSVSLGPPRILCGSVGPAHWTDVSHRGSW